VKRPQTVALTTASESVLGVAMRRR